MRAAPAPARPSPCTSTAPGRAEAVTGYARRIGLFSATMLVVGGIIGSGIFLNPAVVAERAGTPGRTPGVWVLGGAIAVLGGLIFAELGARRPEAGGGYAYLRDAYGPLPAFLYGWILLLVIATGAIAAVAVSFARYAAVLVNTGPNAHLPIAIGAIVFLSGVNYVGVRAGAVVQNLFTILKLAALALLIVAGLFAGGVVRAHPMVATESAALSLAAALVPVLFACGGWQQTNFVAAELLEPQRTLPRAIVLGVAIVVLVYVLANFTYLRVLGPEGLAASDAPAAAVLERALGPTGRTLIAAGIAASTFGFLNLVILVSPRVYQAMAADGLFFPALARLHPRYQTPAAAIVVQGVWAVILTITGRYGDLLDYVVFGDWIFFALTASTLLVFRARERRGVDAVAPGFRVPWAPAVTAAFVLAGIYVVLGSAASNRANALKGVALLALGIPVFRYWRRPA